jgi:glycosyltransferase involved in cell wall biosynthesis/ADP-heptose:LPS heptosyltransferase
MNMGEYKCAVYGAGASAKLKIDIFKLPPYTFIPADAPNDKFGADQLLELLQHHPVDHIIFVGIDIWTYSRIFEQLLQLQHRKRFMWAFIFPYDCVEPRSDWIEWANMVPFPCVYSRYGFNVLKPEVPHVKYYRPPLFLSTSFTSMPKQKRLQLRRQYFPILKEDDFLFGWVGNNQVRKDPQRLLIAYSEIRKKRKDVYLYLHTQMEKGVYNLSQLGMDLGLKTGDLISKGPKQQDWVSPNMLIEIYNCFDALVNTSLQEGLSWTLLEAMLCGVPVIASDTTAQTELLEGGVGELVPCTELAFIPVVGKQGSTWIRSYACKTDDIKKSMIKVIEDEDLRKKYAAKGITRANKWLQGVDNINSLLKEMEQRRHSKPTHIPKTKIDKVLFAQHSSAGDVLMTTRCFKGLAEQYQKPLVFMTQRQYMDIVQNNPYLDDVIEWDEAVAPQYLRYVNPHKERILPGHWGRNCNSILSDFYWKLLLIEPDDFFIDRQPYNEFPSTEKPLAVVHTTGGDAFFRTYKYMDHVCRGLADKYTTVQLGSKDDFDAKADIDLRGKLTFRQSAWVMEKAVLSVNVDSFISHLAGALGVSQVTLFGSGNVHVVRPLQTKGHLQCLVPDYVMDCLGLGPCSGAVRNCPLPCTGTHDPRTILSAIHTMEEKDQIRSRDEHTTNSYSIEYAE